LVCGKFARRSAVGFAGLGHVLDARARQGAELRSRLAPIAAADLCEGDHATGNLATDGTDNTDNFGMIDPAMCTENCGDLSLCPSVNQWPKKSGLLQGCSSKSWESAPAARRGLVGCEMDRERVARSTQSRVMTSASSPRRARQGHGDRVIRGPDRQGGVKQHERATAGRLARNLDASTWVLVP